MKKIMLAVLIFPGFTCLAQPGSGEMQKMFGDKVTDDISWYIPGYSNTGSQSYWIEHDTLFKCGSYFGNKISMKDIDFAKKNITQNKSITKANTNDKVFILSLSAVQGKSALEGSCFMDKVFFNRPSAEPVKLYFGNKAQAEEAFTFLKNWKHGDTPEKLALKPSMEDLTQQATNNINWDFNSSGDASKKTDAPKQADTPTLDDLLASGDTTTTQEEKTDYADDVSYDAIDKILAEAAKNSKANSEKSNNSSSGSEFDSQLLELINGMKDNYKTLNGGFVKDNEYKCKVQLDGSVNTAIWTGMMGNPYPVADFGEFKTENEAKKVYNSVLKKVNNSSKMPCSMVQQEEYVSEMGRTQVWIPFDGQGTLDPALKDFSLLLEMVKSVKFDKDYHSEDIYFVTLKVQ